MKKHNKNKFIAILGLGVLAMIGTYNAVMINSESSLGSSGTFKRLDEVYGVVKEGRSIAVVSNWQKLATPKTKKAEKIEDQKTAQVEASHTQTDIAAIQENLNLNLVEVANPKKWEKGVTPDQFSGNISTSNGIIDSLYASLPGDLSLDISFAEMNGNVFEYDLNGEIYSGMMYQIDQNAYMVTLTNGPLEGTRLRFTGETGQLSQEDSLAYLAENHNVEVGSFGEESAPMNTEMNSVQETAVNAPTFNFNDQQTI